MNYVLEFVMIFAIGSMAGWVLELFYRRFFSNVNTEKRWINPGFLVGPCLPIYGFGLCTLYVLAKLPLSGVSSEWLRRLILFGCMAAGMTLIELIAGLLCTRFLHVKLWDYSDRRFNYKGIICPTFSFYWSLLGAAYYFLIHPHILHALKWLSNNLMFSFFLGIFFGVFLLDLIYSVQLVARLRKYAADNAILIRYEELKAQIQAYGERKRNMLYFFFAFRSSHPLTESLHNYLKAHINEEDFRLLRHKSKR